MPRRKPKPESKTDQQEVPPDRIPHWWDDTEENFLPGIYDDDTADSQPAAE